MKIIRIGVCLLISSNFAYAQKAVDSVGIKAFTVMRMFDKHHVQPVVWNDSTSSVFFDLWMNTLDEERELFTKADRQSLNAYRFLLDDQLKAKSSAFFKTSSAIYIKRYRQHDSIRNLILSKPLLSGSAMKYQANYKDDAADDRTLLSRMEACARMSVLSRIEDAAEAGGDSSLNLSTEKFSVYEKSARELLKKRRNTGVLEYLGNDQTFLSSLQTSYLNTIAQVYDPHSDFFSFDQKEQYRNEVNAMEFRSGITISIDEDGEKIVDFVEPGSGAWKSGQINKGDILISVKYGGVNYRLKELDAEQTMQLLSSLGSKAEYVVKKPSGETKTLVITQTAEEDEDERVASFVIRGKKKIGYINLPGFYSSEYEKGQMPKGCAEDVAKEIFKLKRDGIEGLVFDLRFNGGGSMWEAIQLIGIFIDAGPVAVHKGTKDPKPEILKDPSRGTIWDGPLVVLINGASASASEFFAAAIQDYNRGIIAGGRTFGKGTSQVVLALDTTAEVIDKSSGDFVKVTKGRFYRIAGGTVQWSGVTPDIELPDGFSADEHETQFPTALRPDAVLPATYKKLQQLAVPALRTSSEARIKNNAYFNLLRSGTIADSLEKFQAIPLDWSGYSKAVLADRKLTENMNPENLLTDSVTVERNSFDKPKYSKLTPDKSEEEAEMLRVIGKTPEIIEACRILEQL